MPLNLRYMVQLRAFQRSPLTKVLSLNKNTKILLFSALKYRRIKVPRSYLWSWVMNKSKEDINQSQVELELGFWRACHHYSQAPGLHRHHQLISEHLAESLFSTVLQEATATILRVHIRWVQLAMSRLDSVLSTSHGIASLFTFFWSLSPLISFPKRDIWERERRGWGKTIFLAWLPHWGWKGGWAL